MNPLNLDLACTALNQGGVIAYPTEAVWGLGCDPFNESAVKRILALKQRPMEKGLILVAANKNQLAPLLDGLEDSELGRLDSSWPGPTTWIIPDKSAIFPSWVRGEA